MSVINHRFYRDLLGRISLYSSLLIALALLPGAIWAAGAVYYCFKPGALAAAVFIAAEALLLLVGLFRFRALAALLVVELAVAAAFAMITPEHCFRRTVWQRPWAVASGVEISSSGTIMLRNIRDFHYRSTDDYDVRYLDHRVAVGELESADIALSHWDNMEAVAHSMITFNFRGGKSVVFSLETRLPEGAEQASLPGFYKNYALIMLAGTPRDLYGLRLYHRGESLYVYRLAVTPDKLKRLFSIVAGRMQMINTGIEFYNTLTRNCTTGILPFLLQLEKSDIEDIRMVCNGFSDKMLFERNMLYRRPGENFASLKARSLVPGLASGTGSMALRYQGESNCRYLQQRREIRPE